MEISIQLEEAAFLMKGWRDSFDVIGFDPVPIMTRLSEMLENGAYVIINKLDAQLKNKLLYEYMEVAPDYTCSLNSFRNNLITASLRMALGISVVNGYYLFTQPQTSTIRRLICLSMVPIEPMQSYAIGLLAIAMDTVDTVEYYRMENSKLMPVFFNKLRRLNDLPESEFGVKHVISEFPLSRMMQQAFILRFLTAMKSDLFCNMHLETVSQSDNLNLILSYLTIEDSYDERLVSETLKYLLTLMDCEDFCYTFLAHGGLECILYIPRVSILNNDLSMVIYTLLQYEGVMYTVCNARKAWLGCLISMVLWLLEDWEFVSTKQNNYMALFLACNFRFIGLLNEFDAHCGLTKLHSMLAVVADQPFSNKASLDLCVAYKSYLYTHLVVRCQQPQIKVDKSSLEHSNSMMEMILKEDNIEWMPVEYLLQLGSLKSILKIIYQSSYHCAPLEADIMKIECALGVLAIASSVHSVKILLSESMDFANELLTGLDVTLKVAMNCGFEKIALRIIVNCICGPNGPSDRMLNLVRFSHGFMILVDVLKETEDETNEVLKKLAKRALKVLLKFDEIKQIVSKILPKDIYCLEGNEESFIKKSNILEILSKFQLGLHTRTKAVSLSKHIIYSKYAPLQVFKLQKNNYPLFTCANFMNNANTLVTADNKGEVRIYNLDTKRIDKIFITEEGIEQLEVRHGGGYILLSKANQCTPTPSDSFLCCIKSHSCKIFKGQSFMEFNHFGEQNMVLGTSWGCATGPQFRNSGQRSAISTVLTKLRLTLTIVSFYLTVFFLT
ncbi:PREDICTED: protein mahjong-like isoform X2 [Nicrophorus vespilloides]|uniref:Protein mahjong-like isoform X2 n=1 Tax=Nicrophorus vespilloides TaxID=110193 RepID=A0ABM1MU15_NICVS|nr:PREDICTED: protein mahjong-like isoform X2 [Nicrophorus vespilloides]